MNEGVSVGTWSSGTSWLFALVCLRLKDRAQKRGATRGRDDAVGITYHVGLGPWLGLGSGARGLV